MENTKFLSATFYFSSNNFVYLICWSSVLSFTCCGVIPASKRGLCQLFASQCKVSDLPNFDTEIQTLHRWTVACFTNTGIFVLVYMSYCLIYVILKYISYPLLSAFFFSLSDIV